MDAETIRKLYDREDPATPEEVAQTASEVERDPAAARNLFQVILAMSGEDAVFQTLLQHILNSVVIDLVANRMQGDDEFALVIGRRILKMMAAMAPPRPARRAGSYRKTKAG